jgi:hypothetical protein
MRAYHVRIVLHRVSSSKSEQTDFFTPLSLWQPLPTHPHKSTARRNATFNPRGKDYRFGPIALDWVDLDNMSSSLFVSKGRADPKGAFTARVVSSSKVEAKMVPRTSNCYFRSSKPHQIRDYESSERGRPCFSRCRATETRRDKRGNVHAGCQSRHARKCRQRWLYARRASCTLLDDAVGFPRLYRSRTGGHGTPENDSVGVSCIKCLHSFYEVRSSHTGIRPRTGL